MSSKKLIYLSVLAIFVTTFVSCVNEPGEEDYQKEEYVRSFIKEFGLYDLDHNWCASFPSAITLDKEANSVKVYAEHKGKYHLVASYVKPQAGDLLFETPENCSSILIQVDGRKYLAKADLDNRTSVTKFTGNSSVINGTSLESELKLTETPYMYLYAAEDLGSVGDWDFNDIVFAVSYIDGNSPQAQTIRIYPLAAGGTLETYLYFGETQVSEEWHSLFGSSTTQMINTFAGSQVRLPKHYYEIPRPEGWTVNSELNFRLKILEKGEVGQKNERWINRKVVDDFHEVMNIPQILILPGDFKWPVEKVKITSAYRYFPKWVSDHFDTDWLDKVTPNPSLVINWSPSQIPQ